MKSVESRLNSWQVSKVDSEFMAMSKVDREFVASVENRRRINGNVGSRQRIHGKRRKFDSEWQVSKVNSEFMASVESRQRIHGKHRSRQGIHCKHRKLTAIRGKRRKSTANNERAPVSGLAGYWSLNYSGSRVIHTETLQVSQNILIKSSFHNNIDSLIFKNHFELQ